MVFVGVAVGALVYLVVTQPDWGIRGWAERLAMAALLIPIITIHRDPALFPLNRAHWSLFFELLANILHALVLWRLHTRALAALVAMSALLFAWSCHYVGGGTAGAFQENWHFGFFRVLFAYSCGMLMARMWQTRRPNGGRAAERCDGLAGCHFLPPICHSQTHAYPRPPSWWRTVAGKRGSDRQHQPCR